LLIHAYPPAQTALTLFSAFCSILLVLFAVPPTRWFAGGARLRGDWRFVGVVVALFAFIAAVLAVPQGRLLFELTALPLWQYLLIFGLSLVWAFLCHLVWRFGILDRWLGTVEDPGNLLAREEARARAAVAPGVDTA
jgi:hypothetical protein